MDKAKIEKAIDKVFGGFPASQLSFFKTVGGINLGGLPDGTEVTAGAIEKLTGGTMAGSTFGNYASTARTAAQTNDSLEGRPLDELSKAVRGWNASLTGLPPELRIVAAVEARSRGRQSSQAMSFTDIRGTLASYLADDDDSEESTDENDADE